MEDFQTPQSKFSLIECERRFNNKTLVSFYNKYNFKPQKKYVPFDYNGFRYRLNLETGELEYYDTKTCLYSQGSSLRRTKILLSMLLEMNEFDYFCTFTFDKTRIDRNNEESVYKKFKLYCKHLKVKFPQLGYITVPERHKVQAKVEDEDNEYLFYFEDEKGAIHFHMLLKLNGHTLKELGFAKTDKVCCSWATKKNGIANIGYFERTKHLHKLTPTDGLPIFNITSFKLGYTTASRIASPEVCKTYVKKYISKSLGISTSKFKKRFYYSDNLAVPEIVKREMGQGFDEPVQLGKVGNISLIRDFEEVEKFNEDVKCNFNEKFNVLQYWFDNDKFDNFIDSREKGYIPVETKTPFDNEQLEF